MKNNSSHVINSPLIPLPHPVRFFRHYILLIISPQSSVEQHHFITLFSFHCQTMELPS